MALALGVRLGVYEVTAQIGEGGMGQVYRARDTTLQRDVALKILPDAFTADPDRLARFTREARTLASLNHPNIAHIHGVEESSGVRALVMELVEGEDLSRRIARGPIPSHEAIPIACQIADALEAAHEQAIVHRDLKPANVKVREDGTVKVLDFGLAKSMEPAGSSPGAPESTTQTTPLMTEVGTILGTAAYMSPEQARGKTVGKAADVWAFGCVLYEMLTGRRTFTGATSTDVLAAILEREPDWTALPVSTPPHVTRLLRRCLEKGLKHRLHDIADARIELERPHAEVELAGTLAGRSSRRSRFLASAAVLAVGAGIGALTSALMFRTPSATPALSQFVETVSDGKTLPSATFGTGSLIALSPDGRTVVYLAREKGQERLFARSLNRLDGLNSASIGEPAARDPFFSPDGAWLG